jgi:hypothetical protein
MTDAAIRWSLRLACPFNLIAAVVFALPSADVAQALALPEFVHPLYRWLVAWFVALFGLAYGWLAMQPAIDRPLLALGAVGKLGAFVLALALWWHGAVPGIVVMVASGDLAFAAYWLGWLGRRPAPRTAQ